MLLVCAECGKTFERKKHLERIKNGKTKYAFCSVPCSNKSKLVTRRRKPPLYSILMRSRRSAKRKGYVFDLDIKYLAYIWKKQKGICPYTGLAITLPENGHYDKNLKSLEKASLDRIDSSKGYVQGNIEFVCLGANWAKSNFSKREALDFFNKIKKQAAVKQPASISQMVD